MFDGPFANPTPSAMRSTYLLILASGVWGASLQYVPDFGTCTSDCSVTLEPVAGCGYFSLTTACCFCNDATYYNNLAQCVGKMCGITELNQTASMITQACTEDCGVQPAVSESDFVSIGNANLPSTIATVVPAPATSPAIPENPPATNTARNETSMKHSLNSTSIQANLFHGTAGSPSSTTPSTTAGSPVSTGNPPTTGSTSTTNGMKAFSNLVPFRLIWLVQRDQTHPPPLRRRGPPAITPP
jgi:hypothetical protein